VEDTGIFEFVDDVGDEREGILVLNRERVQLTVVLHRTELPSFFLTKKKGEAKGEIEGLNITSSGHIIEEGIEGGLFYRTKRVNLAVVFGDGFRFEIDGMIPFAKWREFVRCGFLKNLSIFEVLFRDHLF